jgi:hypothetical protein
MAHQVLAFGDEIEEEAIKQGRDWINYGTRISFSIEWAYQLPILPADQTVARTGALLWASTIISAMLTTQLYTKQRVDYVGQSVSKTGRFLHGSQEYVTTLTNVTA